MKDCTIDVQVYACTVKDITTYDTSLCVIWFLYYNCFIYFIDFERGLVTIASFDCLHIRQIEEASIHFIVYQYGEYIKVDWQTLHTSSESQCSPG